MHLCPKCGGMAEQLAVQNLIKPFWNRLPLFFAYPFNTTVIVFMCVLSVFMTLFSAPGALSMIIQMLLFGVLLKYCFAVLRETARGNMKPPEINERTISDDFIVVAKYWLLGFLFLVSALACFVVFARFSETVGFATGMTLFAACIIALLLVLPAQVIVLATSGRLLSALNPAVSVRMAFRVGPQYLLMYFFLIILYLAPGALGYFVRPVAPGLVSVFVFALANCYYSIVAHHLMGYVILQHHDTIGYDVEFQDMAAGKESHAKNAYHGLLNRVNILIKEGRHEQAADLIRAETDGDITNLALAERYYHLLKIVQRNQDMLAHAKTLLDLLVRANRGEEAADVYLECVAVDPSFNPRASTLMKIAASLSAAGNHLASLEAYNRFIRHSPDHPLVPKAYFLAAGVFHEKMLSPEKAVKTLKRLIRNHPEHEIVPYAEKYLRKIEQRP